MLSEKRYYWSGKGQRTTLLVFYQQINTNWRTQISLRNWKQNVKILHNKGNEGSDSFTCFPSVMLK